MRKKRPAPPHAFKKGHKKLGGSKKGSKHKITILRENARLLALQKGITPLEVLQGISSDPTVSLDTRVNAARAAAPYVHRKMPQVLEFRDLRDLTDEQLLKLISDADKKDADRNET